MSSLPCYVEGTRPRGTAVTHAVHLTPSAAIVKALAFARSEPEIAVSIAVLGVGPVLDVHRAARRLRWVEPSRPAKALSTTRAEAVLRRVATFRPEMNP